MSSRSSSGTASPACPVATSTCSNRKIGTWFEPGPDVARVSEKAPSTGDTRSMRAGTMLSSQPLADTQLLDVREKVVDRRVVAVADAAHERHERAACTRVAHCEPRERRRQAVTVALRAHVRLPDRGRPAPPGGRRVCLRCEHRDVLHPVAPKRQIRDEAGQPTADDRDAWHYFTEPASNPCTK